MLMLLGIVLFALTAIGPTCHTMHRMHICAQSSKPQAWFTLRLPPRKQHGSSL